MGRRPGLRRPQAGTCRAAAVGSIKKKCLNVPSPHNGERVADAVGQASRLPEREARKPGEGFNLGKKSRKESGFLLLAKPLT